MHYKINDVIFRDVIAKFLVLKKWGILYWWLKLWMRVSCLAPDKKLLKSKQWHHNRFWWRHLSRVSIVNLEKGVWPNETLQHFENISIIIILRSWRHLRVLALSSFSTWIITSAISICKLIRICPEHDNIFDRNKISTVCQCLTILLSYAKYYVSILLVYNLWY